MLRFLFSALVFISFQVEASDAQLKLGMKTLKGLTGCYIVDYNYAETESLKEGYVVDKRLYDIDKVKTVKEWIYSEKISPTKIRIQHVLFATDLNGKFIEGSELKHQAEDWEYNASFLYDFSAPSTWIVKNLTNTPDLWTRRVTHLDDGLRYQCAAQWNETTAYPEWSCDNYAPIPGREYRDMGRKDYNTIQRSTRIIAYGDNWLERQDNIKTIDQAGVRTPLAREAGKNWYVRLPDSECTPIMNFAKPRMEFWSLLRQVWESVLIGDRDFIEKTPAGAPPRFSKISEVEEAYYNKSLSDSTIRQSAQDEILKAINDYRAN